MLPFRITKTSSRAFRTSPIFCLNFRIKERNQLTTSFTRPFVTNSPSIIPLKPAPHSSIAPRIIPAALRRQASTMAPIPKAMSGILIEETGGIDVLKWKTDIPVPELKDGEILVRNEFIGVNYIDT